jgi:aryl-alcohol dehydrogenase-like predicted oxidoreductase
LAKFDCIQPPYNLITRDIEYELLPLCAGEGVGVCVYNPLAGGLLTGKHDPKNSPEKDTRFGLKSIGKMYYERYWLDVNFEAVDRLKTIARELGQPLPQFALSWILNNKLVTSVICGCSSIKQLEQNLGAVDVKLSQEALAACDEVWQQLRPLRFFYGR